MSDCWKPISEKRLERLRKHGHEPRPDNPIECIWLVGTPKSICGFNMIDFRVMFEDDSLGGYYPKCPYLKGLQGKVN